MTPYFVRVFAKAGVLPMLMYLLLGVLLLVFQTPAGASDTPPGLVRIKEGTKASCFRGEKISFYVQLLSPALFSGAARFKVPESGDGLFYQVQGSPILGTDRVGGEQYASQLHEFWFFPKRSGEITIAPITVQFTTADYLKTEMQALELATEPFMVTVEEVPGVDPAQAIIVTEDFNARQSWQPSPADGVTGAAYTRTIRMEAQNVASIFLPELAFQEVEGVAIYREPPEVQDNNQRGEVTASRTEIVTYLFEREGGYTIPDVRIGWFNSTTRQLEEVVLTGASLHIAPDPNRPAEHNNQNLTREEGDWGKRPLLVILLVLAGMSFLLWHFRVPLQKRLAWGREWYRRSVMATYIELINACEANTPLEAYNTLYFWLRRRYGAKMRTVGQFAEQSASTELREDLRDMDRLLFSGQKSADAWQGRSLLIHVLRRARMGVGRSSSTTFEKHNDSLNF